MQTRYIGIDPGRSGGIAFLDPEDRFVWAGKMPETPQEFRNTIANIMQSRPATGRARIIIELVWAMPRIERGGHPVSMGASTSFKFGKSAGLLEGVLVGMKLPYELVAPAKWQGPLGVRGLGTDKTDKKNAHKRRAEMLLAKGKYRSTQDLKITHAVADAILLAEYGRLTDDDGLFSQLAHSKGHH